jgi:hypothetical protein
LVFLSGLWSTTTVQARNQLYSTTLGAGRAYFAGGWNGNPEDSNRVDIFTLCSAGYRYASDINDCYICAAGSYSVAGDTDCRLCPIGSYNPTAGANACTNCPAGTEFHIEQCCSLFTTLVFVCVFVLRNYYNKYGQHTIERLQLNQPQFNVFSVKPPLPLRLKKALMVARKISCT